MAANRGVFSPPGSRLWREALGNIADCACADGRTAFDGLIYLHGSTCSDEVDLTMTFAHELQHFIQHSTALTLWAANTVAFNTLRHLNMPDFVALGLRAYDIPIERDARIVARRVAEDLFGAETVLRHIEVKIAERVTEQDAADWDCIRGLDVSTPYDLALETRLFFPRLRSCRSELARALRQFQNDPDFKGVDLDALLNGDAPGLG
jgi:hypothetical protein